MSSFSLSGRVLADTSISLKQVHCKHFQSLIKSKNCMYWKRKLQQGRENINIWYWISNDNVYIKPPTFPLNKIEKIKSAISSSF